MNIIKQIESYLPYNQQEKDDKKRFMNSIRYEKNLFTRENIHHHFSVSAWITNKEKTKVLLAYHKIYKSYTWLGGHLDGNENTLDVIYKEIEEESGLKNIRLLQDTIFSFEILAVIKHKKNMQTVEAHEHVNVTYLFEADENDTLILNSQEHKDLAWIANKDLLSITKEQHMKPIYKKLMNKVEDLKEKFIEL